MIQISIKLLLVFLTKLSLIYSTTLVNDVNPNTTVGTSVGPLNGTDSYTIQYSQLAQIENNGTENSLLASLSIDSGFYRNGSNGTDNYTNPAHNAFDNFPQDIMPEWVKNNGGIILHIFFLGYCCLGLGVVCDIYFLPSLEIISAKLKLSPDIAGATFMAIGTSAPELFTSIIGVFVSQDDIGIGTILGTAVFNLIVIPAACGFAVMAFCPKTPEISRFPILRDSIFYILTIITLILCIKDNHVDWVESLVMIGMFVIYLVLMYFNSQYSDVIKGYSDENVEIDENGERIPLLKDQSVEKTVLEKAHQEWNSDGKGTFSISSEHKRRTRSGSQKRISFRDIEIENEDDWIEDNVFCKWFLMPLVLLFKITLPKPTNYCFIITFLISIVWIGSLTYICVWMVTIIGFTFGLPDTVSGLTLLAAGTSVPELITSVLVVKKASQADMAICNSIGSNIFDILFCLGVPWFLKSVIYMFQMGTIDLLATSVPINSEALPLTTFSLLLSIFALVITFQFTQWKLGFTVGITCSIIYVVFVVVSSIMEINLG